MSTEVRQSKERTGARWYDIKYKASDYTFPSDEPRIDQVQFDAEYMHVELTDGRRLSIPLRWIPTVYNAPPEEREKYEISRSRTMIFWDPDNCTINDEVRLRDYLVGLPEKGKGKGEVVSQLVSAQT